MRLRAWERWQAAAGTWKGWSICPALLAPEGDLVPPRRSDLRQGASIAEQLGAAMPAAGVLLILDLEPTLGVHVAGRLHQLQLAHPVLVLPRWPYVHGVLSVNTLLHALVTQAERLGPHAQLPNVAFVLDAERSTEVPHRRADDLRADNRYRLAVADLPNVAALRSRGIRHLLKLSSA